MNLSLIILEKHIYTLLVTSCLHIGKNLVIFWVITSEDRDQNIYKSKDFRQHKVNRQASQG